MLGALRHMAQAVPRTGEAHDRSTALLTTRRCRRRLWRLHGSQAVNDHIGRRVAERARSVASGMLPPPTLAQWRLAAEGALDDGDSSEADDSEDLSVELDDGTGPRPRPVGVRESAAQRLAKAALSASAAVARTVEKWRAAVFQAEGGRHGMAVRGDDEGESDDELEADDDDDAGESTDAEVRAMEEERGEAAARAARATGVMMRRPVARRAMRVWIAVAIVAGQRQGRAPVGLLSRGVAVVVVVVVAGAGVGVGAGVGAPQEVGCQTGRRAAARRRQVVVVAASEHSGTLGVRRRRQAGWAALLSSGCGTATRWRPARVHERWTCSGGRAGAWRAAQLGGFRAIWWHGGAWRRVAAALWAVQASMAQRARRQTAARARAARVAAQAVAQRMVPSRSVVCMTK